MQRPMSLTHKPLSISLPVQQCPDNDIENIANLSTGIMKIPNHPEYSFGAANLQDKGSIGSGNFGTVSKMLHTESNVEMAVKRIRFQNITRKDQTRLIREHNTIMQSSCENIVKFFGVIFHEGDCWICMELMDVSLDRLYRVVYRNLNARLTEPVIGHITASTLRALQYLKNDLNIMHRDVKPSNILINRNGEVKLCDFGICGELQDSIVKTHDVGCQPYLAPERITKTLEQGYGVKSDVWSFGITLYEIATGEFPYRNWTSPFEQVETVVKGDPPMLMPNGDTSYSLDLCNFVNACLTKDYKFRPRYAELMEKDFYTRNASAERKTLMILGEFALYALKYAEEPRA